MIFDLVLANRTQRVEVVRLPESDSYRCTLDGKTYEFQACQLQPGVLSLLLEGRASRCVLDESPEGPAILYAGKRYPYSVEDPRSLRSRRSHAAGVDGPRPVKAPMPGRVVRILAEAGVEVAHHQGIVVIEAMKMQNELKAPKAGRIVSLAVVTGDTVQAGDVLAIVE
jgi:biotin carboxyl carrier protein